jgi:hypothetical protein
MLKVCFCAKQVDGLMASRQILMSKKDSIKPPIIKNYEMLALGTLYYFIQNNDS